MKEFLNGLGSAAAVFGMLVCLIAGVSRVMGSYYLMGFQANTLFSVGISFLVLAILLKVETLIQRS